MYKVRGFFCLLLQLGFICLVMPTFGAETVTVAVAANFANPLEALKKNYEKSGDTSVKVTVASSGTLYAQLMQGAPYDLFLSADKERPARLHENGFCFEPFEYARGRVVLWSKKRSLSEAPDWKTAVRNDRLRRIAIANPKLAPYGMVLEPALATVFTPEEQQVKLVYGQNVAQAFQFAAAGGTDAAFTSLSFALSEAGMSGRYWEIEEAEDVSQWGCIVSATTRRAATERFVQSLKSAAAAELIKSFGYH